MRLPSDHEARLILALVCSMGNEPELLPLEMERDALNTLALRLLYSSIVHMDRLALPGAAGGYQDFLADMDAAVHVRLLPEHVYEFMERLTDTSGVPHCFFLLLPEEEVHTLTCSKR